MTDLVVVKACLAAFGKPDGVPSSAPRMLHNRMAQLRVGSDSGMSPDDSVDKHAVRRKREEARMRAILQMNVGSAMGMAGPGELLFEEPLPSCARWGDQILQQYAVRGFGPVELGDMPRLAENTRPTLPGPLQINSERDRMGPHASTRMLNSQPVPICSYGQMVEEARAMAASAITSSFDVGISVGLGVVDQKATLIPEGEPAAAFNDRAAAAEDGERVWPPFALNSTGNAKEAKDVVKQIMSTFSDMAVKPEVLCAISGVYTSAVEFVLASESLQTVHRDAFAALGIGAHGYTRADVARAGDRARLLAAAAHVMGHSELGDALTELANGPIADCARKPWS